MDVAYGLLYSFFEVLEILKNVWVKRAWGHDGTQWCFLELFRQLQKTALRTEVFSLTTWYARTFHAMNLLLRGEVALWMK